ncbi:MAG: aminotransferase class I/II-fold pyridoxal phosphate-dependent enzyme [Parvularculaceae bacterium]|uniref:aminotransferase class I/II-fold pyridoxal phosphate-dependent enzyme n=1 Tax=Methylocystis sp. TaxID=1911079 RepID=UPI003D150410
MTSRDARDFPSLIDFAQNKLGVLDAAGLRRDLSPNDRAGPARILRNGRVLLSFCCNDYYSLSRHPKVIAAAARALAEFGAGAGASRLVTGNSSLYAALEEKLAAMKGAEAALVFGSGYLANMGVIPALVGAGDVILIDSLAHACMFAGARLSGATMKIFRHNDLDHLRDLLGARAARTLVLTETVFSMDGDRAPAAAMRALCVESGAWLLTDDAHGLGREDESRAPLQLGTLSKGAGSYGGYLCAPTPVIELMKSRARTLVFSTGLPPASLAAAKAALDIIETEPARCARPTKLAALFCEALGLPAPESPIVPLIIGAPQAALAASKHLEAEGFLVTAIRPPSVPAGTARLRVTFCADHQESDVLRLADSIRRTGAPPPR